MAHKGQHGMWILERGEAQWLAWREWWLGPFAHRFWPENSKRTAMVTEWPPETDEAAALVAEYWIGVRNKIIEDEKKTKLGGSGWKHPIPVLPKPWIRWSAEERERKVRWFAEEDNPPDIRRSAGEAARMVREAVASLRAPRPQPRNKSDHPTRMAAE